MPGPMDKLVKPQRKVTLSSDRENARFYASGRGSRKKAEEEAAKSYALTDKRGKVLFETGDPGTKAARIAQRRFNQVRVLNAALKSIRTSEKDSLKIHERREKLLRELRRDRPVPSKKKGGNRPTNA